MMTKTCLLIFALFTFCDCRPRAPMLRGPRGYLTQKNVNSRIIGGQDSVPGAWPWQLLLEGLGSGGIWFPYCGAVLVAPNYALTGAGCIDGVPGPNSLRVVGGLHALLDREGTQTSVIAAMKMHEGYLNGQASIANDIGVLTLGEPFVLGGNVQAAVLPANNNNDFSTTNCIITGWGETSNDSPDLADILQQATISAMTTAQCQAALNDIGGVIWDGHICTHDNIDTRITCFGDGGGPLNCLEGAEWVVAGIGSFIVSDGTICFPEYPSGFTRTGFYLDWIATNTP